MAGTDWRLEGEWMKELATSLVIPSHRNSTAAAKITAAAKNQNSCRKRKRNDRILLYLDCRARCN